MERFAPITVIVQRPCNSFRCLLIFRMQSIVALRILNDERLLANERRGDFFLFFGGGESI